MRVLELVYPGLPPTSNKIYSKGTILRPEARVYAEKFAAYMAQNYLAEISQLKKTRHAVYAMHLRFYFDSLINETYGDTRISPSRRAKELYKKLDLTNRIKLLEDCVRDAIVIDDSRTFAASQTKAMDPHPRVEIDVDELDPESFGIPREYLMR